MMISPFPDPRLHSSLEEEGIGHAIDLLVGTEASEEQKGDFLTALHQRGETAEELAGFARALLGRSVVPAINRSEGGPLLELCGTGGDRAGLLNISTAAMFVAAGAGARVVKHGNRAVSSNCGSADVLEALGVSIHLDPARVGEVLERAGCVFLLASHFHPTIAAVAAIRRSLAALGQMTIFNLLGPLLNPAEPDFQLAGIYRPEKLSLYAQAMGLLGRKSAWAVHGQGAEGGVDELSITGPSRVVAVSLGAKGPELSEFCVLPEELGFAPVTTPELLLGGDALTNARRIEAILSGVETGPAREMILLNAGAALHLAGLAEGLEEGIFLARQGLDSGSANNVLSSLRKASTAAAI
jgi:anthranilate phosphoribosyltransferase